MAAVQAVVEGVFTHWSALSMTTFSTSAPDTVAGVDAPCGGETRMPAAPVFSMVRLLTVTLLALMARPLMPPAPLMMVLAAVPPLDSMVRPVSAVGTVFDDPAANV